MKHEPNDPLKTRTATHPGSLRTVQLALLSSAVLDIPRRTRFVISMAALAGIVLIAMASLTGGDTQYVRTDRVIHFLGYMVLASVFVMGLRPALFIPALLALVASGWAIEWLQSLVGREADFIDGLANTSGIALGAALGLIGRAVYSFIRTELATADVRRNTFAFETGEAIFLEGDPSTQFFVIKNGLVRLTRATAESDAASLVAGPGEVIGVMGVIQGKPYSATATAAMPTQVFGMDAKQLVQDAEGKEQPTLTVLRALARRLRDTNERLEVALADRDGGGEPSHEPRT